MANKEELLPEEDRRLVEERLKALDQGIRLPKSLSAEVLSQRLTVKDRKNYREADHPDFVAWRRYAGMVAALIIVLMALVVVTNSNFQLGGLIGRSTGTAVQENAAASADAGSSAAADQEEATSEEAARSRLYATSYADISAALGRAAVWQGSQNKTAVADAAPNPENADKAQSGVTGVSAVFQPGFTQSPGEMADSVKTDGTYLYYYTPSSAQQQEGKVSIVEAESMKLVSTVSTGVCAGVDLFVRDNRLILVERDMKNVASVLYDASVTTAESDGKGGKQQPEVSAADAAKEKQETDPYGVTAVSIYDISDPGAPKLARSFLQDGAYVDSRMVDSRLYLITSKSLYSQLTQVRAPLVCDILPVVRDSVSGGSHVLDAASVAIAPGCSSQVYSTVTLIDTAAENVQAVSNAVLGGASAYFSGSAVYICYDSRDEATGASSVGIVKMAAGQDLAVTAQTTLKGDLSQPFAINRMNDTLRVGTVAVEQGTGIKRNNIYLLDGTLRLVGSVEGFASGETVQEFRFVGSMAYAVTYRQERPVFALDLSDPADPGILGQVDMAPLPKYLYPVSDTQLLGLGQAADGKGLNLSSYEVTAGQVPKQQGSTALPGAECYSDALADSRAFLYDSGSKTAAFPVVCRQAGTDKGVGKLLYWGYAVYGVADDGSFTSRGIVSHTDKLDDSYILTNQLGVSRGLVLDETLYTFSGGRIVSTGLEDMKQKAELNLN